MHGAYDFLKALTIVLTVAAVTTVVFHWLRQPVVLGYVLAGLIIGPHVPVPLVVDQQIVLTLSELGVILLMFSLGLEFSLRKLAKVLPTAGTTAFVQCSVMIWLGFLCARALGWTSQESLFTGAIVAISSTTIIAKAFDEQGIRGKLRELVVGILIVEDLIAILLMATLTAVASGAGLSAGALALTVGKLLGFLVGLVVVGLLVVPRTVRAVVKIGSGETTLVTAIAICFGVAVLAHAFGYSVALGAFIAGSLVAESGEAEKIEALVHPVRDVFAAVFFVSVGMTIDPALVAEHWLAVTVLTVAVVVGKIVSVTFGAFLTGNGTRTSIAAGMSLAQIGEFSFIIAQLGLTLGATRGFIYPVAVAVSAATTLVTPLSIRASGPVASWVDRKLPRPLQTFAALYGSWLERLRRAPRSQSTAARTRRLAVLLVVDALLLAGCIVVASFAHGGVGAALARVSQLEPAVASVLVLVGCAVLAVPFALGVFRVARRLGGTFAEMALPRAEGVALDRAHAPRRTLVLTLQLACLIVAGAVVLVVTQPFVPGAWVALALLLVVGVLGIALWRSAADLHGHVRAGAELIVELLAAQSTEAAPPGDFHAVHEALPGIGEPAPFRLEPGSLAAGRSLAQLDLRGQTGATVLAITRPHGGVLVPTAREVLQAGDVLALAGTEEAIDAARALLGPGPG